MRDDRVQLGDEVVLGLLRRHRPDWHADLSRPLGVPLVDGSQPPRDLDDALTPWIIQLADVGPGTS